MALFPGLQWKMTVNAFSKFWLSLKSCHMIDITHNIHTSSHTHPFNGLLSRTTWVSWYQKGKTSLDFTEARDSKWQWHQLGHIQVCTLLQTDNHANTSPLSLLQAGCPSCCPTNSTEGTHPPNRLFWCVDNADNNSEAEEWADGRGNRRVGLGQHGANDRSCKHGARWCRGQMQPAERWRSDNVSERCQSSGTAAVDMSELRQGSWLWHFVCVNFLQ